MLLQGGKTIPSLFSGLTAPTVTEEGRESWLERRRHIAAAKISWKSGKKTKREMPLRKQYPAANFIKLHDFDS